MPSKKPATNNAASSLPASKGHVEVFDVYDTRYGSIFVDGVLADQYYKESPIPYLLKTKNRQRYAKMAGVNESDLRFSNSYIEEAIDAKGHDGNDYCEDYAKCAGLGVTPAFSRLTLLQLEDRGE
jgi:hypothetical protein